ncbi:hypothetical protein ACQX2H_03865, partial [Corynebacterium diphtheriae]
FSKTLIDFFSASRHHERGWGSVLKNPDRLPVASRLHYARLGFSSQKPDRLQVAQKILFNMVFWAT